MTEIMHVSADGSGAYGSLREALRRAPAGAEIRLGAGEYDLGRALPFVTGPAERLGAATPAVRMVPMVSA